MKNMRSAGFSQPPICRLQQYVQPKDIYLYRVADLQHEYKYEYTAAVHTGTSGMMEMHTRYCFITQCDKVSHPLGRTFDFLDERESAESELRTRLWKYLASISPRHFFPCVRPPPLPGFGENRSRRNIFQGNAV